MDMHKSGVMKDTLNDEYYDENDCFYRTWYIYIYYSIQS